MTPKTLRSIARALATIARALETEAKVSPRQEGRPEAVRKLKLSSARLAALRQHGQYLGLIRNLGAAQKARVKREREQRGPVAAIRLARRLKAA
ncbi:MAG: hypothetical protein U0599_07140 [Vicinamibacteria bacterium]